MRTLLLSAAVFALSAATPLSQKENTAKLVGTWKLVGASATNATGVVNHTPFGPNPTGSLIYTAQGRMAVLVSYSSRKPLSGAVRFASPATERAEAFATFFAYSGRYSLAGDQVTHHVEVASVPNWVNTDLVRVFTIQGGRLTLRTPSLSVGGTMQTSDLVWERVA
jgi:hypothetical protein